jgi:hypothetical protein
MVEPGSVGRAVSNIHSSSSSDTAITELADAAGEQMSELLARTSGIAHDLNNMVCTMLGYGVLILDDTPVDDPNHDFLARLVEAGTEAKRLIAELTATAHGPMPSPFPDPGPTP